MSSQISIFLIDTILGLFSLALLLRFYLQLLRVPFYNPLSKFLVTVTNFVVRPARRVIPGWAGVDLSTIVLAWLVECTVVTSVYALKGYSFSASIGGIAGSIALLGATKVVTVMLYIMLIMIIVQAILSWINPNSPLAPLLGSLTNPLLGFFRKRIPAIASVDLSPLFALIVIQLLLIVVSGLQIEILGHL